MRVRSACLCCFGALLAVAFVLLSSCASVKCMLGAHSTHRAERKPVEAESIGWQKIDPVDGMTIYAKGSGPPILLLHEIPGLIPETVRFADSLVKRGYRVYLPLFFGKFHDDVGLPRQLVVCAGLNFNCYSGKESRVLGKLAMLRTRIENDRQHAHQKIGIIGMCLTGGMPLALVGKRVGAIVLSQPSVPFPLTKGTRHSLAVDEKRYEEARDAGVHILAIRFEQDCLAVPERFDRLRAKVGGLLETHVVPSCDPRAHSVLTVEGQHQHGGRVEDEAKKAIERTYRFLDTYVRR